MSDRSELTAPVKLCMNEAPGRRRFLAQLGAGALVVALGGACKRDSEATARARAQVRADGRPRLPPGQEVIERLRPMGGRPGLQSPSNYRLRLHGAVARPVTLTLADLLAFEQTEQTCDVHCVTGWSCLDSAWVGVRLATLAERVGVAPTARHVIFEAAHGYTANVRLEEALAPDVLLAHEHAGKPLALDHGSPVRGLVPDLYFWKSAKYLTGVRFEADDAPGFWETRGYHNHADPWEEERYS